MRTSITCNELLVWLIHYSIYPQGRCNDKYNSRGWEKIIGQHVVHDETAGNKVIHTGTQEGQMIEKAFIEKELFYVTE